MWGQHQSLGFFGLRAPKETSGVEQPAHRHVVDLNEALREGEELLEVYWRVREHPDSAPYSGGVYDAWPALQSEVLAHARQEEDAIWEFLRWQEKEAARV